MRIGLAASALVLAACGTTVAGSEPEATDRQADSASITRTVDQSAGTRSNAKVGPVRAIRLATAAVNGGRVFDMELDRERGRLVWELDVASSSKAYDVKLNARSGKVVRLERDHTPERGMELLKIAKVRAGKAVRTATAAVQRADLSALELDRWHRRVVWEAELTTASGIE